MISPNDARVTPIAQAPSKMGRFKPIRTQEELDAVLANRLRRQSLKHAQEVAALTVQIRRLQEMLALTALDLIDN